MKAIKKPVTIDYEQLQCTEKSLKKVLKFMGQEVNTPCNMSKDKFTDYFNNCHSIGGLIIKTLEGEHLASWEDYVIKGIKGEFYPCKPDIFKLTYDTLEKEGKQ